MSAWERGEETQTWTCAPMLSVTKREDGTFEVNEIEETCDENEFRYEDERAGVPW